VDYWTLDVQLADESEAERIAALLRGVLPENRVVVTVDPALWLTRHYDAASVRMLRDALRRYRAEDEACRLGLLEDCDEWLATAREL
jgi:hypothetical protein